MATHCFFCGNRVGDEGCSLCGTVRSSRDERRVRAPCPRCGTEARLVPFGLGEAALQACPRCKGMFVSAIDWDTLFDVFAQEPLPDIVVPDAEGPSVYGPYRSAPMSNRERIDLEGDVRCPTCNAMMERLEFAAISRVIIDVCPTHGVWLDAGELERIIDSIHPHPLPEPAIDVAAAKAPRPMPAPPPETLVEAAREPLTDSSIHEATYVAPDADWKQSIPPPPPPTPERASEVARAPAPQIPWTVQLGRALRHLVGMVVSRRS